MKLLAARYEQVNEISVIVELRWFESFESFKAYTDKWRGDIWRLVETQ
jgi:hypothetical protein